MSNSVNSRPSGRGALGLLHAASLGILGGWALLLIEYVAVLLVHRAALTSAWEVRAASLRALPALSFLVLFPCALGGVFAAQLRAHAPALRFGVRSGWALFFLASFAAVAWGIGGGRHLSALETRVGFSVVVGLAVAACVFLLLPRISMLLGRDGPATNKVRLVGAEALALVGVGVIVLLEFANHFILVRLYPAFHLALSLLALFLAGAIGVWVLSRRRSFARPARTSYLVFAFVAASGLAFVPASRSLAHFDNIRWIISEGSPTLSWGLRAMEWVAPPPAIDKSLLHMPLGQRRPTRAVDIRGRDILLISIDALRADHLGAYGYQRPVSPAIDALAQEGVVFEAAYAPTPHTSYSITSLMTGKYMRPLLLQGAGEDSDLWATLLRSYDYRTAAFYPPAIFFIDTARFRSFQEKNLGFEYSKVEFAEGDLRVGQVKRYLDSVPDGRRIFTWVHLFGPHEPYVPHPEFDFGKTDIDLYDGEIRAADDAVGRIIALARKRDPNVVIFLTADHGEEFGEHGGRYHGTSVYDEQVRVPLIVAGPGLAKGRRVDAPVQTVDLLPTVLDGLKIPAPPRIRGRSLAGYLSVTEPPKAEDRFALAETDDYTLLAKEDKRLICKRRSGACQLFDIEADPGQKQDVSAKYPEILKKMRKEALSLGQSHGTYESQGLRAEGKGWPPAILLGISGDAQVAPQLAELLDDADVGIRRKAAELLFSLGTPTQAPALRFALTREEDDEARAWLALALTRLGQGAPLVYELLTSPREELRRNAALALAESGKDDGEEILVTWWATERNLEFETARRLLSALAVIRSKEAVPSLIGRLGDVRLRPWIAETLAEIGDRDARPHLTKYFIEERYLSAREPLGQAILKLGGDEELIVPLRRFLGVPERMAQGLELAQQAGILDEVGGPKDADRLRLAQFSDSGVELTVVVPPSPEKDGRVRLIVRARSKTGVGGTILFQPSRPRIALKKGEVRVRNQPSFDTEKSLEVSLPDGSSKASDLEPPFLELAVDLPPEFGAKPGHHLGLQVFAPGHLEVAALAAVPLREELPPPAPKPWKPPTADSGQNPKSYEGE